MIKNYIKIAFRNFSRNSSNSIINVLGLSIGIACCLLILLWVFDEMSYDNWNSQAERTYRVAAEINFAGSHQNFAVAPAPLKQAIIDDFPEVESAVRFRNYGSDLVKRYDQNYKEENILFADSSLFNVFDITLVEGDRSALVAPNTVIISESIAEKYFPGESPIGKTLTFNDRIVSEVTGVFQDLPSNSHFNVDFFRSLTGGREANNGIWVSHNFPTYYVLREGTDPKAFQEKFFPHILEKYIGPQIQQMMGTTYEEVAQSGAFIRYYHQPLRSIHLHSDLVAEIGANGSYQYVWIFLSAALFILLIAIVNFMNLTTAKSSLRAKEIGLRKVMGSMKQNLVAQFLCESLIMTTISFIISLAIAQVALPYYNNLANKELNIPFSDPGFWFVSIMGITVIGLLVGSYPAFYLSRFNPIQTLTNRLNGRGGNFKLRNGLVVFQFLIAVVLIVGTLGIQKQMNYVQTKKLGFDRDQVLILNDVYALGNNSRAFKNKIKEHPSIKKATYSSYLPVPSARSDSPLCKSSEIREDNCVAMQQWEIDEDYFETMSIKIVSGRNFDPAKATDSLAIILNQAAIDLFGFEDPIDQTVFSTFDKNDDNSFIGAPVKIIGVVEDFHYESLRENIRPLGFMLSESLGSMSIKFTGSPDEVITYAEDQWSSMAPGQPFSYEFMDDSFDTIYRTEMRVGKIFSIFSGLGIFIACLGLFGLAAFATERRTREIGIRKVLGASVLGVIALLSKDFIKLILIALVIALPISWYFMNQWLSNFAYKASLGTGTFIIAALAAIIVALVTVSFHAIKSALMNPVDSIRTE